MNKKKYRLRNGVVVVPETELGWVRVVDTQDAVFTDPSSACCTARELSNLWAVGARNVLRPCTADPLSWEGGAWGEQFDVVEEVVGDDPATRNVEGKPYVLVDAKGLGCSGCAFCVDDCCKLVVEYKLLPQCKGESDSIWREVTE